MIPCSKAAAPFGVAALAMMTACPASPIADICCTDFKAGTDMTGVQFVGDAQTNGQFVAFAQAAGDIGATASGAVSDVTGACMSIATDLGDDPTAGAGKTGTAALSFWCGEAIARLNAVAGGSLSGQLDIAVEPPSCTLSVQAVASCQAKCDVSGACNVQATPPKCTGGTLEISCKGNCAGSASAPSIDCTGACSGQCSGSCEAGGGATVDCVGKCDGQCAAKAGVGTGVQTDGSCHGSCSGTCKLDAAAHVTCTGTCAGKCDASCRATAGQVAVKCSGTCDTGDFQPVSCEGGKLEGGCNVDAHCQSNCDASASAKAECRPPRVDIAAKGTSPAFATIAATLEKNLPSILVVAQARGQSFLDLVKTTLDGAVTLSVSGKLDVKGTACIGVALSSAQQGAADFTEAFSQSVKVVAAVGVPGS
jgi:hypothetical protein